MSETSTFKSNNISADNDQYGLRWVQSVWGWVPEWTVEPSTTHIELLARQHLDEPCTVEFFNQGGFNKLYKIHTESDRTYLLRVSLPVDPVLKTASEVATLAYLRKHTSIAVPTVLAYDDTNHNILRLSWILMSYEPFPSLEATWKTLSMDRKHDIVKKIAQYHALLFDIRWDFIGSIYAQNNNNFRLGPVTSTMFLRTPNSTNRGPFTNSFVWLQTRLQVTIDQQLHIVATSNDEDEIEDAETSLDLAKRLLKLLPDVFNLNTSHEPAGCILVHNDLSMSNILIGDDKPVVVDWENVSTLPIWLACQLPKFLTGRVRTEEPLRVDYGTEELYWEHRREYEIGQLRATFETTMDTLQPTWVEIYRSSSLKRDFELAVHNCDEGMSHKTIKRWLDSLKNERVQASLEEMMFK